ncbi:hypothetical protein FJT64_008300 [Amphibalanus amphitrite]|uniref:Uncharacterized protein n=1 Tax=Amphibalanus amphitrite TaxID=1232801 RepID=A0A6A4VK06_AMPAM|nr:hypothetical protein FJT64_008300 [Amphibalanus amphitrite]
MIESDVTLLPAEVAADPSLSLAVRAACNHSVVTGDEGFWGAFLAGGQVTVPPPERSDAEGFGWLRLTIPAGRRPALDRRQMMLNCPAHTARWRHFVIMRRSFSAGRVGRFWTAVTAD